MTPRRHQIARYVPGAGLFGPVARDGQLCRAVMPCADAPGEWVVRFANDGATARVSVIDLRPVEEARGLFETEIVFPI